MNPTESRQGRLISWAAHDAARNMAIDEALLQSVAQGGQPALRFYGWSRPTLSLGYFQTSAAASDWLCRTGVIPDEPAAFVMRPNLPRFCSSNSGGVVSARSSPAEILESVGSSGSFDLVRRSTGGGAILHHHELTYSLVLPMPVSDTGARTAVYQGAHAAVMETLGQWRIRPIPYRQSIVSSQPSPGLDADRQSEPFLCFQRRTDEDLIISGYKVLGSAQRRVRGALLQHGSLVLQVSPWAQAVPGLAELTGIHLTSSVVADSLAGSIAEHVGCSFSEGAITADEQQLADFICRERFGDLGWTLRR